MPEYTGLALLSVGVVVALEVLLLRTGLFRQAQFWCAMAIVFFFQILVDGWLTKLDNPIVVYGDPFNLGVRFPFDIPIEDFAFGFSMVTATILLWQWHKGLKGHTGRHEDEDNNGRLDRHQGDSHG